MSVGSEAIEKQLADANRRLEQAFSSDALRGDWNAISSEVLRLERELARSRSEPYAVQSDFPVEWDIGAPRPFLLCNDSQTFLTFYVHEPKPDWDETTDSMVDPTSIYSESLCLVTFNHCASAKFGHPNDEVWSGHFLEGRGLEGDRVQLVRNSPWIAEMAKTNSVHRADDAEVWTLLNHYIFWFKDNTFECLAESYQVEVTTEAMDSLLSRVQGLLLQPVL